MSNPASPFYKDMFDPGWREREAAQAALARRMFEAMPVHTLAAGAVRNHATGRVFQVAFLAADIPQEVAP